MAAVIYSWMIVAYGVLVKGGKYALAPEDNPNNLPIVPEAYREKVAEWVVTHEVGEDRAQNSRHNAWRLFVCVERSDARAGYLDVARGLRADRDGGGGRKHDSSSRRIDRIPLRMG